MAKVEVIVVNPVLPPLPPPHVKINLDLSEEEARALAEVFSRIGGDSYRTHRAMIDSIINSISRAGIKYIAYEFLEPGVLYFKNAK
jgi:hypothetical protein